MGLLACVLKSVSVLVFFNLIFTLISKQSVVCNSLFIGAQDSRLESQSFSILHSVEVENFPGKFNHNNVGHRGLLLGEGRSASKAVD